MQALPGPLIYQGDPQAVYAGESLAQTLRQLEAYGRDGLPVLSADGRQVQGWITNPSVLQALADRIGSSAPRQSTANGPAASGNPARPSQPTPLPGYQVLEITVGPDSPPLASRCAASAGRPAASPSPSCGSAACENPTRISPWPTVTASACSHHAAGSPSAPPRGEEDGERRTGAVAALDARACRSVVMAL